MNLAVEYKAIGVAPKIRAFRPKATDFEFLTFEEADRFLAAADPEWKGLLYVAIKTGLRIGELLALKWEDVDLKAGKLNVRSNLWRDQEGTPKSDKPREIPLSARTCAFMTAMRHLKGAYVFCDAAGERLTQNMIKRVAEQTCAKAGLAKRISSNRPSIRVLS